MKPELIAHRGFSSDCPENTLVAIQRAIDFGVDFIEIDVHLTYDEVPVLIHDASTHRTTNDAISRKISSLSYEEIRNLDAGSWFSEEYAGIRIPSLQELLHLDRKETGLMIELKQDIFPAKKVVSAVTEVLAKAAKNPRIYLGSFAHEIVEEVRRQTPHYPVIGIIEDDQGLHQFQSMNIQQMAIWYKMITPSLLHRLHEQEIKIWAFTVDIPQHAQFLASLGVEGVITNNPALIKPCLLG